MEALELLDLLLARGHVAEAGPAAGPGVAAGAVALGVHVAVVLRDLGAGPVRHAARPRRVLRVPPRPPGERGLAVELRPPGREVHRGLADRSAQRASYNIMQIGQLDIIY